MLLGAAALVVLGFGLDAFREPTAALWLTVVINGTRYEGPWDEASLLGALQAAYAAPRQ